MTKLISSRILYSGWLNLRMVSIEAENGDILERHVVEMHRAVAVLPYNVSKRTVLFASMPRAAVAVMGLDDFLEPAGGVLDDPNPEICVRREAMEELGVRLRHLEHVGLFWSIPAASTERVDYYLAEYGVDDRTGLGGGCPEERENITVHEMSIKEAWEKMERGEISDLKSSFLLMALRIRMPRIFD